ncbi:syntaxin-17 [Caerostris extrusa]|uniref:Syntaxin-17 n=1 Tax=Caerostris extrusa TaxID=172846 RepID=A0AAV4MZK0_CAEEX|nr:syntaxin-17 [Caerostris extrusa]
MPRLLFGYVIQLFSKSAYYSRMDSTPTETEEVPKLPFRRLKLPLDQLVKTAIPFHVQQLKEHSDNIEGLKGKSQPLQLRQEQLKASKTLQLLKADLYEIQQLHLKVEDGDQQQFEQLIRDSLKSAVEAISDFMAFHTDVLGPFLDIDGEQVVESSDFPKLVCSGDLDDPVDLSADLRPEDSQLLVHDRPSSGNSSFLLRQLIEIHSLISDFASRVFRQQDSIDTIQCNIDQTRENVRIGTKYLKKASLMKAATFPLVGAVVGGVVLGPVGALVGFKLLGSALCIASGSALGYGAGVKIKKKHEDVCNNIELKAITYHSKSKSLSSPELSVGTETKKES